MKIPSVTKAMAVAVSFLAASACGGGSRLETRTFQLENVDPHEVVGLIEPYVYGDRERAPGTMSYNGQGLTVRELPENLNRIALVLKEYDRPVPTVRLRFQVIEADGFSGADPTIADVQSELEKLFQFRGYRLAASSVLQGLAHESFRQQLGGPDPSYGIFGDVMRVTPGSVAIRVELRRGSDFVLFETSVSMPMGQTVVLGSGQPRGDHPAAILVVTPEIAD